MASVNGDEPKFRRSPQRHDPAFAPSARKNKEERMKLTATLPGVSAALLLALLASPAAHAQFGSNLVVNGNAEAGPGSASGNDVLPVPGFTTTGNFTVAQYDASISGPADRGANFFAGGPNNASSSAMQVISLLPEASVINAGGATFSLSAYLGGYDGQDDNATLTATFLGAGNSVLSTAQIGPVLSADRNGVTEVLFRSLNGLVPVGAQSVNLTLQMTRLQGSYNDGYADDLSLVLRPNSPVPEASTTVSLGLLLALGMGAMVIAAKKRRKA
jgi:hypothetical protein